MLRPWSSIVYILTICCSLIAYTGRNAVGAGPDWILLDENGDSRFYYDEGGTVKETESTAKVRTRVIYTDRGKADALKILGNEQFGKIYETRYLYALDCKTQQSRLLEAQHLDREGGILKKTDLSAATDWEEIPPYARMGLVLEKACGE